MRRVDSLEKTDAGRDLGQEEKGMTEDEMAGWHHCLDGHEYIYMENPVDRGLWRAAIYGVTQSRTQLKQLSMHACLHTYIKLKYSTIKSLF